MNPNTSIPLNKLIAWEGNVRKTESDKGIDELAASIKAHGLLQSLVVRKDKGEKFAVVAGRRRLKALQRLAKEKHITADHSVNCQTIEAEANATQKHLHVTAIDVDAKCVHMAYLQFSLLHIPAVIVHGNALSLEEWGHWYTPAHIMDGWTHRLKRRTEQNPQPIITIAEPQKPAQIIPQQPATQLSLF